MFEGEHDNSTNTNSIDDIRDATENETSRKTLKRQNTFSGAESESPSKISRLPFHVEFAPNLFLSVSHLKDRKFVHIRKYFSSERGTMLPTREGATFSEMRFAVLLEIQNEIDTRYFQWLNNHPVTDYSCFIGGRWCIRIISSSLRIDIRKYNASKNGDRMPSKTGITFKLKDWRSLSQRIDELCQTDEKIREAIPCYYTHESASKVRLCYECTPFAHHRPRAEPSDDVIDMSILFSNEQKGQGLQPSIEHPRI
jgi:hypothetical protein